MFLVQTFHISRSRLPLHMDFAQILALNVFEGRNQPHPFSYAEEAGLRLRKLAWVGFSCDTTATNFATVKSCESSKQQCLGMIAGLGLEPKDETDPNDGMHCKSCTW
ncbi:uncharacterized protein MYCFIDRAFT_173316 [Pseudocercospora fijiensis CIRAD86]|uniref:Uncharacterized protein n=1 Tax=Pseudocercospora fijiensis (strain CIRAD86) TaxID=383855 RepID=M2ZZG7_PSEFD|nr:uncharacterized protein MYCFIDRAFT_173316 [Pseudocercospora fijiensis CIRAD86]EME84299.1 hypothetical protein MYCFIDRAFT_173316 [Pseudocercospora fijiensis CIRAD86]